MIYCYWYQKPEVSPDEDLSSVMDSGMLFLFMWVSDSASLSIFEKILIYGKLI